ncbi:electron transfer flavoprotein subunit alpha/FixB family protein [Candidatus Neomarinimicrobiota bacterium]
MGKIVSFIETLEGKSRNNSLEALRAAQILANAQGHALTIVLFTDGSIPDGLEGYKANHFIIGKSPDLADYSSEHYVEAMIQIIAREKPEIILAGHSYQARDWLPRLAARSQFSMISDCISFKTDPTLLWTRQVFQGKMDADITIDASGAIVSFQSGSYKADELESGAPEVVNLDLDLSHVESKIRRSVRAKAGIATVELSSADRIVSVGRGIGEETSIQLVRDLAEALQAELGSSRPVVDYNWLEHDRQIGSSGQTVTPDLYLAVGISGAIQHQVGMKNSGCIVAINKDADAPIFEIADYGIVGDLFEIVPALTAALKERQAD